MPLNIDHPAAAMQALQFKPDIIRLGAEPDAPIPIAALPTRAFE